MLTRWPTRKDWFCDDENHGNLFFFLAVASRQDEGKLEKLSKTNYKIMRKMTVDIEGVHLIIWNLVLFGFC